MAIITLNSSNNLKARRFNRTKEYFAKKDADRELARKISKAYAKLTHVDHPIVKQEYIGSCCLPHVAMYAVGSSKSKQLTAR